MTDKEALRRFKAVCKMCDAVDCDECKGKNAIDALERSIGEVPVANRISQWDNMNEIIYKCPKCNYEFNFYATHEKYCHSCGTHIKWENMPTHVLTKEWCSRYHDSDYNTQQSMIKELNKQILEEL